MSTNIDMVTIPRADYESMTTRLENLDDIIAAYEGLASGPALPSEYAMRIIEDGEHPIKVWRDYRGIKQSELSALSGVSGAYISEIERGKKPGSIEAFKALADALDTTIDALTV